MNKFTVTIITIQDVIPSDLYKIINKAMRKQKINSEIMVKDESDRQNRRIDEQ